jgi:pimeloyl-ACP methyl ester carboxylesterase
MIEHRGVGVSRRNNAGHDLALDEVTLQEVLLDIEVVLNTENVEKVVLYGSSYGSYLACAFASRFPDRVAGMVLDSAMIETGNQASSAARLNELYWHGTPQTARQAAAVQRLVSSRQIDVRRAGFPIQLLHETGGPGAVARMLELLERGKGAGAWAWIEKLGSAEIMTSRPFMMEFDLVARIAFTELNYAVTHDVSAGPLCADAIYDHLVENYPPYTEEPVDLVSALSTFDWPVIVLSGDRDIRTPRSVSERIARQVQNGQLVPIRQHGHSALDNAPQIALQTMSLMIAHLSSEQLPLGNGVAFTAKPTIMGRILNLRMRIASLMPRRNRTAELTT